LAKSTRKPIRLRHKSWALSAALAVLAIGGWACALARWPPFPLSLVGAVGCLLAVLFAVDFMGRLTETVLAALTAAQRAAEGETRARMTGPIVPTRRDEADELSGWINHLISQLPRPPRRSANSDNTDSLTGLCSHRHLHERLLEEIKRADRYDHAVSLLMVDVDNFRQFNETHDHAGGDEALRQVAHVIMAAVRTTDLASRYGGDEFAVMLPETALAGALQVAGKIRSEVAAKELRLPGGQRGKMDGIARLTVSIGAASFPQHSVQKNGLIMAADVAMYMAKYSGRDKVCPFNRVPGAQETTDPYQLYRFLQNSDWGALEALVASVDARDRITGGHSKKVTTFAVTLARAIGLSDYDVEAVRTAALLHDVGKIGIPDRVLVKDGALTAEERALMESHPSVGESLARRSLSLSSALPGILYHHERFDGKGYPTGLARDDIPLVARIIAIADAYDAMISHRHYREAPGRSAALRELELGAGRQWDPELVRAFLRLEADGHLSGDQVEPAPARTIA
jgi:diguanylate cyclase (GGDEF)-like protein/putative nucleotidyltransferase with HDIG domain